MHTPKHDQEANWETIAAFIRENGFGMLVNVDEEGTPHATHIPMTLVEKTPGNFVLHGHIARINPQWKWFTRSTTLAVFSGHHSYISSSWYEKEKIPTWNYMAVHIHGQMRVLEEKELIQSLEVMMDHYEAPSACPVHIHDITPKTLDNNVKAIVGFELEVKTVNARFKLSQTRNDNDYFSVIAHLRALGDENSLRIAAEMEARRQPSA
ncbi:PaiB family negative transcriptional regulator [Chitinophaga niastensis]|uniref:PaiB family negative transcriptional regulator n=1 Tax=Chitinophaga niastensis TaxID=536980 RepID=A0A2P8HNL9_CHINA|nr:FMN-binding negative transcriptional regulator [Chitinophaga niastensis]PSL47757.1 PaiB family negative transcriptional regulator [Chitinophaga niastensis]